MVKKICYVNPPLLMKRPIAQIASILSKDRDFRVSIFTPRLAFKKRDNSLHYSKLEGINVIDYPCINPPIQSEWPIPGLSFLKKSVDILKNNDIMHIWVPFYISSTFLIFLKRLFFNNKKLILTMDTIPSYSFKVNALWDFLFKFYFRVIGKLIFSGVDIITIYGNSFKKYANAAGMPSEKIMITPTGINIKIKDSDKDIRKEFKIKKDEKIILFVGLLVDRKGIDLIIKTARKLKDKKVKFIIVGDGPCRKKNELLAKELQVDNKVIFTGFRNDMHNFYNQADIFFFPSRGEGLAGVLIEAANYKIPIVSSKIAGTIDLIEDGKTGYLCPVENADEYSKRLIHLLDNKKIGKEFAENGKIKIKNQFNWMKNLKNFREIYGEMSKKEKIQEEEYIFPYHYLSLVIPHRYLPYLNRTERIKKAVIDLKKESVADIGCGDAFLLYLLNEVNIDKEGYDISERALRFAKAFNPEIKFSAYDVIKKPLLKKYSMIILQDIIEHLNSEDLKKAIVNIENSLKKNGAIILTVPSLNVEVEEKHYQHFDLDKIRGYFKNFKVSRFEYLNKISKKQLLYTWLCWITYPLELMKKPAIYHKCLSLATKASKSKANEKNARELLVVLVKKE